MLYRILFAATVMIGALVPAMSQAGYYQGQSATSTQTPILYYSSSCSHCQEVINFINTSGYQVEKRNLSNPSYRAEFRNLGQSKVPVLVVKSRVIVGASPIIDYLKNTH